MSTRSVEGVRPVNEVTGVGLMTVPEVADALRLSRKATYALLWSGALGYVRIGRRLRIPRRELTRFIEERMVGLGALRSRRAGESGAGRVRMQRGSGTRPELGEKGVADA